METSILIAKFMGPVMLVAGCSMFLNRKKMTAIFEDFVNSPGLIFFAGFIALILGLAFVIFHNRWVAGWPVLITIYGWLALVGGILRIGFPDLAISIGKWMLEKEMMLTVSGAANILLGAFFTYQGYLA